jgi:hypothetical protein
MTRGGRRFELPQMVTLRAIPEQVFLHGTHDLHTT